MPNNHQLVEIKFMVWPPALAHYAEGHSSSPQWDASSFVIVICYFYKTLSWWVFRTFLHLSYPVGLWWIKPKLERLNKHPGVIASVWLLIGPLRYTNTSLILYFLKKIPIVLPLTCSLVWKSLAGPQEHPASLWKPLRAENLPTWNPAQLIPS